MLDTLTNSAADVLFSNHADEQHAFRLWHRSNAPRSAWEPVAAGPTYSACVDLIGAGGRRAGKWLVLEAGREP